MRCLILVIFGLGVCMLQMGYVETEMAEPTETELPTMMAEPDECEHQGCDCNCNCASQVPVYPLGGSHASVYAALDELGNDYGHRPSYSSYSGGYSRPKCINRDCECECNCLYNSQYTGAKMNKAPTAIINPATEEVSLPSPVQFDGSMSSDPEGGPLSFYWTIPSGFTFTGDTDSASEIIVIVPSEAGQFPIRLTVTDTGGASDTFKATLTVIIE